MKFHLEVIKPASYDKVNNLLFHSVLLSIKHASWLGKKMIIHVNIKKRCNITIYVTVYKYKLNILVHLMIKIAFYQTTIFRISKKVKMLLIFGEDEVRRSYRGTYCLNYLILITNLALFHLQYVLLHHKIYSLVTIIGARGGYKNYYYRVDNLT